MTDVKIECTNTNVIAVGCEHDHLYFYLTDQVWNWLKDHVDDTFDEEAWDYTNGVVDDYWLFSFKDPAKALLFKLTWGGV